MRFEAKHSQLKSFLSASKNRRNVCKTIASKHQRYLSVKHEACADGPVCNCKYFVGVSLPAAVQTLLGDDMPLKSAKANHTKYEAGNIVVIDDSNFVKIICLKLQQDRLFLLGQVLQSVEVQNFCVYEVTERDEYVMTDYCCLADYHPLAKYSQAHKVYVIPRHMVKRFSHV